MADARAVAFRVRGDLKASIQRYPQAPQREGPGHAALSKRLLLYYTGPLRTRLIGHRLNAVCREVQIMEWSDPNCVP
jgi:hypothetical protein